MPINEITETDLSAFAVYPSLDDYQRIATKSAIYPGQGSPLGLAYVALKLNGEAGELAEHVGKAMRDDALIPIFAHSGECSNHNEYASIAGKLTAERHALLIKEVGDILWYLSAACNELGVTLHEAAFTNLRKLADRTARGKLQGSGDER